MHAYTRVALYITPHLARGLEPNFFHVRYCFRSNYKYGSSGQNCIPHNNIPRPPSRPAL